MPHEAIGTNTGQAGSFTRLPNGEIARRTTSSLGFLNGLADSILIGEPSSTTEKIEYFNGGLAGTLVLTQLITYATSTKDKIVSVEETIA
jgi:hypothetical protein